MAGGVKWGVRVEGSWVMLVTDGLSAFRAERNYRAMGYPAQAVVSRDGVGWLAVPDWSMLRPDPAPPTRAKMRAPKWLVRRRAGRRAIAWLCERMGADAVPVSGLWWRRVRRGNGVKGA